MSDNVSFGNIPMLEPDRYESDEFTFYGIPTQYLYFQRENGRKKFTVLIQMYFQPT